MNKQEILTELLLDDTFKAWVLSGGKENHLYWQRWQKMHPEYIGVLNEAKKALLALQEDKLQLSEERKDVLRQKVINISRSGEWSQVHLHPSPKKKQIPMWSRVAAAMLVLVACSWLLYTFKWDQTEEMQYTTAYGEIKTIVLPDNSVVTLNGNSSIKYSDQKDASRQREVWLEGEGFFEVEKKFAHAPNQTAGTVPVKFIVHTGSMEVEVLGTQFNVNNRRDETKVVLKSGKIKLNVKAGEKIEEIFMQPGEMVAFNEVSKALTKSIVNPDLHASWKDHQLIFEEVSLGKIAHILEDAYGVDVKFEDPQLAQEQFTGLVPSDDLNVLLEAFTKLYGIQVTQEQHSIIFHSQ